MDPEDLVPPAVGLGFAAIGVLAPGAADEVLEVLALGQASLLAIVLSVSLLSVQVSTNQYAPLLTRVYRKGTFDAIMKRFGASILVALGLRAALPLLGGGVQGVGVGLAAGLAAWSFLALSALERRLLAFLDPEPVLDELVEEVSLARYRSFTRSRHEEGAIERNPLLEIFQVARTALDNNDNYGALQAVDALQRATAQLLAELADRPADEQRAAGEDVHRVFDYWDQLARVAVERGADDVLHALADGLSAVGEGAVADADPAVTERAAAATVAFCEHAAAADRLEGHHLEALAAYAPADRSVAATVAEGAVDLAAGGADLAAVADVLAALVAEGNRDAVRAALAREDDVATPLRERLAERDRAVPEG